MAPMFNNYGKRVYFNIDNEWDEVTDIVKTYIHIADKEEEMSDDELPFCEMPCENCPECDHFDEFEVLEDDEDYEPDFWGIPDVRRIIFNDPATIVFWEDDTKTVVKCMPGEKFERYAGFAMACMKKMFGSTSRAKAIMEECDSETLRQPEASLTADCSKMEIKDMAHETRSVGLYELIDAFTDAIRNIAESKASGDEVKEKTNETSAE